MDTGEQIGAWGWDQIPQALETLAQADKLIAHYGLGYDFPALEKVHDFHVPQSKQLDTVVIARLKYPNIKELDSAFNATRLQRKLPTMGTEFGKHTIAAWGIRLGIPKLHQDIEDWSQWTQEMQDRCVGDVETTLRLWKYLQPDRMSQQALELEHRIARVCMMMTAAGWPFDMDKAHELHAKLVDEKFKVEQDLKNQFGGWYADKGEFTPKKDNKARGYVAGAPMTKIEWTVFNPGSRPHIERCLRNLGWKPTEFTDAGHAKLDEPIIESVAAEYPQAANLSRYLMLDKRLGQLADGKQAWLTTVHDDGRIHAEYNPMGAITSRASHFNPNIAQVPKCSSEYGRECRELFTVPPGWEQVGADMAGLEGRCFAHYLAKFDGGKYGDALLSGDPHWTVVRAVGFLDGERDKSDGVHTLVRESGAKTLFYAMLYGCGDEKAGKIILECCRALRKQYPDRGTPIYTSFFGADDAPSKRKIQTVGAEAKRKVIVGIEGFERLKRTISCLSDSGFLPGLDKRRIPVRAEYAALNTLLQSAGAILCKQWVCDSYDALLADGLKWGWDGDFVFLGWIHDELQVACRNGLGDRIGQVLTTAARKAGEPFAFRIALDGNTAFGKSWADTH